MRFRYVQPNVNYTQKLRERERATRRKRIILTAKAPTGIPSDQPSRLDSKSHRGTILVPPCNFFEKNSIRMTSESQTRPGSSTFSHEEATEHLWRQLLFPLNGDVDAIQFLFQFTGLFSLSGWRNLNGNSELIVNLAHAVGKLDN